MQPFIACENPTKGTLRFYLCTEGEKYYLFSQDYRKGMADYFKYGLRLDAAHDFSKCHHDSSIGVKRKTFKIVLIGVPVQFWMEISIILSKNWILLMKN